MSARPLRIGLIVPSSNTVMEPDFHRQVGQWGVVSTTRIFLEEVTRAAEFKMLEEDLPRAARLIRTTGPEVVVFGCTSAGALGKMAHDEGIRELIEKEAGARTMTVLGAVLKQLRSLRPAKLAVFTPYNEDLTQGVARALAEGGFPPVKAVGMGIKANLEIGRVTALEIIRFVEAQVGGMAPDCIFLSCTNWRAIEGIEPLREKLGIPILSSNQAVLDVVRQLNAESLDV